MTAILITICALLGVAVLFLHRALDEVRGRMDRAESGLVDVANLSIAVGKLARATHAITKMGDGK